MDKHIRAIVGMLQSPDGMRRCGAAMVLTELAPKDSAVVSALGDALKDANQLLTRYVLEAFEAIQTRNVLPHVLPLLESPDVETKLRAAAIVARVGGDTVADLKGYFEKASPQQKLVLMDILARIHSRQSMDLILEVLFDPDFELVKETCQAVRRHMTDAKPAERAQLHQQVVKFLSSKRVKKNERVLSSGLLLIGYVGAPAAGKVLLKHATPRSPEHVRRNALLALKGLTFSGSAVSQVARQILPYLADRDYLNIVQHVLDLLDRLSLPKSYDAQWRKCLKNQHPSVRAFAARRLAAQDNAAANKLLMSLLQHDDARVSEIAAGTLAHHAGATRLLLEALARERRAEDAWRLAKILKPHSAAIDKKTVKRFAALAGRHLENNDARHEALFYFLGNVDPSAADGVLRDRGLKFKKARKWGRAVECLRQLARAETFDRELRYVLSVCNLKQSAKDLAPHLRAEDHALRGFQAFLGDRGFNLLQRLQKDKTLEAADLYYLGFHFSEGTGDEQRFGRSLLEAVAKRWPRGKEAKAARNKLKLVTAPA